MILLVASVSDELRFRTSTRTFVAAMLRAPSRKPAAKGSWTKAALEEKAAVKQQHWDRLRELRDWAIDKDLKADAALREAPYCLKEGINRGQLHRALAGEIKHIEGRCDYDILTPLEEEKLVEWLKASARNAAGVKEQRNGLRTNGSHRANG